MTEPRIPPLPPDQWPEAMTEALAAIWPPNPRHPRPRREGRPKGLNALGTLAQYPELARAYHVFNGHVLFATSLSLRQRELLVLRVAAIRQSDYEWKQHAVLGADVGLSDDEIARIAEGPDADGWLAARCRHGPRRRRAPRRRQDQRRARGRRWLRSSMSTS